MITLTVIFGVLALGLIAYGVVIVASGSDPRSANVGMFISIAGMAIIALELVIWGVGVIVGSFP